MGNTVDTQKKRRSQGHDPRKHQPAHGHGRHHAHLPTDEEAEDGSIGEEDDDEEGDEDDENREDNLERFITTDADLQQHKHRLTDTTRQQYQRKHQRRRVSGAGRWSQDGSTTVDVRQLDSIVFQPVGRHSSLKGRAAGRASRSRGYKSAARKCCTPCTWILGKIWKFLKWINRLAANPVYHSENLLNGCIFVTVLGFMLHALQIMFPMTKDPVLNEMYAYQNPIGERLEYVMFVANILALIGAYSIIWQTCGPYLFLAPLYMLYLIFLIIVRHSSFTVFAEPDSTKGYTLYRTTEQVLRLIFMMWQFCVVIAYTRQVRADRLARDTFIKARRRRLEFISKTRRHEDRKQFLRDPVRQKTVLLLSDPKRPWLKQTMAAKLAERAFSQNEAIAALWGPVRREVPSKDDMDKQKRLEDEGGATTAGKSPAPANPPVETKKKWFGFF